MAESIDVHPLLSKLWDEAKNGAAAAVLVRSFRPAWWRCENGHSFQRSPRAMLSDAACPDCRRVPSVASIAKTRPSIVPLWNPEKNGDLSPAKVDAAHTGNTWWRCLKGHDYQRSPLLMIRDASCPVCAVAEKSLAMTNPVVAAEWHATRNGDVTPTQVDADHVMNAWWRCPNGHEYQATVRSRARGNRRCPTCYGGWSLENLRAFVKSLLAHVGALNPSELFALAMQAGAFADKDSRPFVMAISSGRFPVSELEKFAEGKPSLVDQFAAEEKLTLEIVDGRAKAAAPADPFALPGAPMPLDEGERVDVDVSREVDDVAAAAAAATASASATATADDAMPLVKTQDALAALDSVLTANADAETVKFLLDSAKAKLWRHAYVNAQEAREQAAAFNGDAYSALVRDRFLAEFDEAEALETPAGYAFRPAPDAPVTPPNLMQRRVAVSVRSERRVGNWSGMGAGKTLSAIVATRVVAASLTVICCPNAVVENWATEIQRAFPASEVAQKTWHPTWSDPLGTAPRYLILNYEHFQQPTSEQELVGFLDRNVVDFVVVDEIHYAKQRDAGVDMSKRKRLVQGLILEAVKKSPELCVLGMSGTPVINTLQEGKSLVEMITGHRHDDLETRATVQNCMRLYQRLVTLGTRWKPDYQIQLDREKVEIDCEGSLDEIREVGRGTTLELEQVLTRLRIPTILKHLAPGEKAIIYTHYVDGIASMLREAVDAAGFRVGMLTGETDDTHLKEFLKPDGSIDVLIASSRIGTGVNGLQYVCNKLIINCLPWTNAEYEQLVGRLYRQGSKFEKVRVVIPVTFAMVNGERWSYCESKLHRLDYKKSIADAAVDGVVPEGNLRTPSQAQQDIMNWLGRLEAGHIAEILRPVIKIPLSGEPTEVARRVARYGDFSRMNNRWYAAGSDATHARLAANPEEWAHYHTMYSQLRASWPVVPYKEEIRWLSEPEREGLVVGDFGCGEALIGKAVSERHRVHSFDHVAIDASVVACDIAQVPLKDGTLDVAILCLALMGANFTDYVREARRCLRLDGSLHIWEPASYFDDVGKFCNKLARLGFDVMSPETEGAFVRIYALRNAKKADPNLVLPFRGYGG
ncbi:MAG: methyltransferase-like protein [Polyangiaceae bacterium]|nr:methyltransferase-like protein [Polyangiaceae bacterium]